MFTVPGITVAQPLRSLALQWLRSKADTVLSKLAVYRVSLAGSTAASLGPNASPGSVPSVAHPAWTVALQVVVSSTDQPLKVPNSVTYAVCVAGSSATWLGEPPTANVTGGAVGQPSRSAALQVKVSSIETVPSPELRM
ncbi:MAG: hypothetical protein ACLP50_18085 [Solirubrobacteraceae bacterium]